MKPKPAARHVAWLRRRGGKPATGGWLWQAVGEGPSESEALRAAERVRHQEWPWAGYSTCE